MGNVFADAIEAIFADPNLAVDAVYRAGGAGDGIALRAVVTRPDRVGDWGESRIAAATCVVKVRVADVAAPAPADTVTIAGETLVVLATPLRRAARLIWEMEARPQ
ncbi:MAG: hypothetical protein U1E43_07625 [Rhodospirillales bacterium]